MTACPDHTAAAFAYHQRTKHHLNRYAAGPGTLDWDDQPDPFRRFEGCEQIPLPMPGSSLPVLFADLDRAENIAAQPMNRDNLGLLLELSFGLSAWKQYGPDRWALRCNPSSGNLHPTEAYLINTDAALLPPGVYHYVSHDHALEKRCEFAAALPSAGIFIALTSIHWREAWKYGERAYRYCQHDAGHALAALRYAAAALGWTVELLAECGDDELARLLGLDRRGDFIAEEHEAPDLLCRILIPDRDEATTGFEALSQNLQSALWYGRALPLSTLHRHRWPIIEDISAAAHKPNTEKPHRQYNSRPLPPTACTATVCTIIRQRRSAQHFDGRTALAWEDFQRMLSAVMPTSRIPFDVWHWPPRVHLALFVHRVENLAPGLYLLPRSPDAVETLRAAMRSEFEWQPVNEDDGAPRLYRLVAADCRRAAQTVSCHQAIAGDSAFSMAMLAEFQQPITAEPWQYRRLFWETGLIGQALYLEAEACGMRGTGIGCFFDDSLHEILGLKDTQFQSLYHFTVGKPLGDARLQTLPAYTHLNRK